MCITMGYKGKILKGCQEKDTSMTKQVAGVEALNFPSDVRSIVERIMKDDIPNACITINGKGGAKGVDGFMCKCVSEECNADSLHSGGSFKKTSLVVQTTMFCIFMFVATIII